MKQPMWTIAGLALAIAAPGVGRAADRPQIVTADVANFYQLYDASSGRPAAAALQSGYLDRGSPGLKDFIENRIVSADALAKRIVDRPEVYARARTCMAVLPRVKARVRRSMQRLATLYPQAVFPPVTVVVGRDNSGGTSGPSGVILGLEVVCHSDHMQADLEDRFVHLIAHEYVHVEQKATDEPQPLLDMALTEGVAEFVAELTSGEASESYIAGWVKGREVEIGERFLRDIERPGHGDWLYNGVGTRQAPGDLGYWVGYRIARSYYRNAHDKRAAIRTLIQLKDARAVLRDSGWRPGL